MEELVDGGQLLGGAVDLSVPVQGEQPTDVFEGRPIVSRDEHPRGRDFIDFLKSALLKFCSIFWVGILNLPGLWPSRRLWRSPDRPSGPSGAGASHSGGTQN